MLRRLRRTADAVVARARFEREMRDELRLHIEHRADDLDAEFPVHTTAAASGAQIVAPRRWSGQAVNAPSSDSLDSTFVPLLLGLVGLVLVVACTNLAT